MPIHKNKQHKAKKIRKSKYLLIFLCSLLLIMIILKIFKGYFFSNIYKANTSNFEPRSFLSVSPTQSTIFPTTFPILEPFTPQSRVPRTQFNLSEWKTFEYPPVAMRFKYPPEWGNPDSKYLPGETGFSFLVRFPNSSFVVGGTSKDYSAGRGGRFSDFNGFGNKFWWKETKNICSSETIFCQTTATSAHIVTTSTREGPSLFPSYARLYFTNRSGQTISGLAFGGSFLSPKLKKYTSDFQISNYETERKSFDAAVIERKLDDISMEQFDEFEKVFETIYVW